MDILFDKINDYLYYHFHESFTSITFRKLDNMLEFNIITKEDTQGIEYGLILHNPTTYFKLFSHVKDLFILLVSDQPINITTYWKDKTLEEFNLKEVDGLDYKDVYKNLKEDNVTDDVISLLLFNEKKDFTEELYQAIKEKEYLRVHIFMQYKREDYLSLLEIARDTFDVRMVEMFYSKADLEPHNLLFYSAFVDDNEVFLDTLKNHQFNKLQINNAFIAACAGGSVFSMHKLLQNPHVDVNINNSLPMRHIIQNKRHNAMKRLLQDHRVIFPTKKYDPALLAISLNHQKMLKMIIQDKRYNFNDIPFILLRTCYNVRSYGSLHILLRDEKFKEVIYTLPISQRAAISTLESVSQIVPIELAFSSD